MKKNRMRAIKVPDLLNQSPRPDYPRHREHQVPCDRYLPSVGPPRPLLSTSPCNQQASRRHPKVTVALYINRLFI